MRRRTFLQLSASSLLPAAEPKRILILGGTGFLGPSTTEAAQSRGHKLTHFNRGKTRPGLFPNLETLHGDRDPKIGEGLKSLEGGKWDVVIDNSGFVPRIVTASAKLLAPNVKHYIYISSISAYADNDKEGADETTALAKLSDPNVETMGANGENYGGLKAACERAAEAAMPGRVTIVRPGFIVGPDDSSGRFTYWPVRVDRGGEVAAPGSPADPLQFIDVRDLGAWLVRVAENGTIGTFNATGPAKRLTTGDFLKACQKHAANPGTITWIPFDFVEKQKAHFPIFVPYTGETKGFHTWSIDRALKAGLTFRPVEETARDTVKWYKTDAGTRNRLAGPTPEKEKELLAAWHAEHK